MRQSTRGSHHRSPGEEETDGTPAPPLSPLDQEERARNLALRILTAAPKSRAQVEQRLAAQGIDEAIIGRLLDRFEQVGLLDDAELAAMVVRTRFAEKKQSRRAIAQELNRKGIPPALAAAALDQLDDDDERTAALELARARLRRTQGLAPEVRIRRALGALGRKGYSSAVAMASIRAALAEEGGVDQDLHEAGTDDHLDDYPDAGPAGY